MKAKREITVAVIIGLIVGLFVVGGIIRARSAIDSLTPSELSLTGKKTPAPTSGEEGFELFLELSTVDNQVLRENQLTIEGSTLPGTYIVILGEKSEYIIIPSDLGQFSQPVELVAGANTIKISVYQEDGTMIDTTLNAVYTESDI